MVSVYYNILQLFLQTSGAILKKFINNVFFQERVLYKYTTEKTFRRKMSDKVS